jgi:hypothetical protein
MCEAMRDIDTAEGACVAGLGLAQRVDELARAGVAMDE